VTGDTSCEAFELAPAYRERLDDVGQRQYSAEIMDDHAHARQLQQSVAAGENAIGAGAGRYVYPLPEEAYAGGATGRHVLKLAVPNDRSTQRDGKAQNRREARLWQQTESPYLVPVVAAHAEGYWLIMPRGERLPEEAPALEPWAGTVTDELDAIWETDITSGNIVVLDGDWRLCDYGVGPLGE
jgi:hypothetical protein